MATQGAVAGAAGEGEWGRVRLVCRGLAEDQAVLKRRGLKESGRQSERALHLRRLERLCSSWPPWGWSPWKLVDLLRAAAVVETAFAGLGCRLWLGRRADWKDLRRDGLRWGRSGTLNGTRTSVDEGAKVQVWGGGGGGLVFAPTF